jgi:hypothetical protein
MPKKDKLAKREGAMAKALAMSVLFKEGVYEAITSVLDELVPTKIDAKKADFKTACGNVIDDAEKEWLWNYLKHYNVALADSSDAKWKVLDNPGSPHW